MTKDLTIIILLYNSAAIIKGCLERIDLQKYEVVVVDNASRDDGLQIVQQNFPAIKTIRLEKNLGYGNGNNVALNQVDTDYALILNPDSVLQEDGIEKILQLMKADSSIALAGPAVFEGYKIDNIASWQGPTDDEWKVINDHGFQSRKQEILQDIFGSKNIYYDKYNENAFLARFISGCALFMNMATMKKIGFFDAEIFLFYEDNEICSRSNDKGYKNVVVADVAVYHINGGSAKRSLKLTFLRSWHLAWSKLYWKGKSKSWFSIKKSALRIAIVSLVQVFFSLSDKEKFVASLASSCGSFAYFLGLKAFRKNGLPRVA